MAASLLPLGLRERKLVTLPWAKDLSSSYEDEGVDELDEGFVGIKKAIVRERERWMRGAEVGLYRGFRVLETGC